MIDRLFEVHLAHQSGEARIGANRLDSKNGGKRGRDRVTPLDGPARPFEGAVQVAQM